MLLLASKVAAGALLAKLIWLLLQHALRLPHLGLVTAPTLVASGPTALSFASTLLVVALLAPVAEEMFFRGALFRKRRLRLA